MIEDIYAKRKQIKVFLEDRIPSEELIGNILQKTYDLVPSKQNLMPYKVLVIGPEDKNTKQAIYDLTCFTSSTHTGTTTNWTAYAPYNLIFTQRLAEPSPFVAEKIERGHSFQCCDPKSYESTNTKVLASIEVGMFSTILTGLCIENGLDVGYLKCFPGWDKKIKWADLPIVDEYPILMMGIGYRKGLPGNRPGETKPDFDEVVCFERE